MTLMWQRLALGSNGTVPSIERHRAHLRLDANANVSSNAAIAKSKISKSGSPSLRYQQRHSHVALEWLNTTVQRNQLGESDTDVGSGIISLNGLNPATQKLRRVHRDRFRLREARTHSIFRARQRHEDLYRPAHRTSRTR